MSNFDALILGTLQGLTEFLPVSSSGHLLLYKSLKGPSNHDLFFFLICHLGTLLSVFFVFQKQLISFFFAKKNLTKIFISILPLFTVPFIKTDIQNLFFNTKYLGFFFLITSLVLWIGNTYSKPKKEQSSYLSCFLIGICQAIAVLPGISRSGMTISCARLLNWELSEAIFYSLMLSVPTILGGAVLELREVTTTSLNANELWFPWVIGFTTAFVSGYFSLKWLVKNPSKLKFKICISYTLGIGILTLLGNLFF